MSRLRWLGSLALACVLVVLGAWGADLRNHPGPVIATISMAVDTRGTGQFFWPGPGGYAEERSTRFELSHGQGVVPYTVELRASAPLERVRVDPGSAEGTVTVERAEFSWRRTKVVLEDGALERAVVPLKALEVLPGGGEPGGGVWMQSTGGDPFFEIRLPDALPDAMARSIRFGFALLLLSVAGFLALLWATRRQLKDFVGQSLEVGGWRIFLVTTALALVLLELLGVGCDGICSPRGARYGTQLFFGALALVLVGQGLLRALGVEAGRGRPRIFLSLLSGQALLVVYVAMRSALQIWIPWATITGTELILVAAAAAAWLFHDMRRQPGTSATTGAVAGGWPSIELALLLAVCLVIGERELPRLVMLSSDPDTHAYFARMLEVLGGVPWGEEDRFHYPLGTGALGFIWAKLAFLDVRDAVTALPLLQTFAAALVLAEAFAYRVHERRVALILFLGALGLTAAAFLIPLYSSYAHMEGAGRQMAIASLAMIPALVVSGRSAMPSVGMTVLFLLSLFVLAVLNPINVVVPVIVLAAYALYGVLERRRVPWWVGVLAALVPLLLLDPYYMALIVGDGTPESRFIVDSALVVKALPEIWNQMLSGFARGPGEFLSGNVAFLPSQTPLFIFSATVLGGVLFWLRRPPATKAAKGLVAGVTVVFALWAADVLFDVLLTDRRFYLLAPYYWLALAQLKIVLVTMLALAVILAAYQRQARAGVAASLAVVIIAISYLGMNSTQQLMERPRVEYCGSLGCVEDDDLAVLQEFESMAKSGELKPGRILLPNSLHEAHREKWIFPVTGARAVPFLDLPPAAFYYYRGDPEFTTANYVRHVCERFDREWLAQREISYVFLPSRRQAACMAGMSMLPSTERIVTRRGNSMIVELQP